uniref:Golgi to ER traffic protein 4 n=1 Tax=Panagrolaimus sp. PS1159 TaxID=55785 RepID=A0AC35F6U1_9BILA
MPKFDKLKQKIQAALVEKNTYEALQIYRTIRNRCKDQEQASECLDLLFDGIQHFAKGKEETTLVDLAEVYADTLVGLNVTPSEKIYSQLSNILSALPSSLSNNDATSPSNIDLRSKFTNDVFKWSRQNSSTTFRNQRGNPALHKIFAKVHWQQGAFNVARLHFLLANDPEEFSKFLIDYTTTQDITEQDESDNYGAQTVFQLLTYKKLRIAQTFFSIYCRDHPKIRDTFPFRKSPLLNFVWLLLSVLQEKNMNHFVYLLEKYNPILDGDCEYKSHLDKIAQLYFKAPSKSSKGGGMFGELLKGFFPAGSDGGVGSNDNYSADEEIASETIQRMSKSIEELHAKDFSKQNAEADKVNPRGFITEPDMFEDARDDSEGVKESSPAPNAKTKPMEMDLD